LPFRTIRDRDQYAHARHTLALLRPRHERPRRCAAEQRDELAPLHVDFALTVVVNRLSAGYHAAGACSMVVGGAHRPTAAAAGKRPNGLSGDVKRLIFARAASLPLGPARRC